MNPEKEEGEEWKTQVERFEWAERDPGANVEDNVRENASIVVLLSSRTGAAESGEMVANDSVIGLSSAPCG